MQTQIQALIAEERDRAAVAITNTEVVWLQIFDGTPSKVSDFIMACRLYFRIKIRRVVVEEQIQ